MTELTTILQLLLLSMWCHGWHHLFSPGEALYFLSKWAHDIYKNAERDKEIKRDEIRAWMLDTNEELDDIGGRTEEQLVEAKRLTIDLHNEKQEENNIKFERKIYFLKPLFLCSICFASIYGTGGYLLLNYTTWGIFPVAIISLISVNKIMQKLV